MSRTTKSKPKIVAKKAASVPESVERIDGRTARAARTRESVIESTTRLMNTGDLRPTAPRIAEEAGVSLRSVFQHFRDLNTLFTTAASRHFERMAEQAEEPLYEGLWEERVRALVRHRAVYWESIANVARAAELQEPFSESVQALLKANRKKAREGIARVFAPELKELEASVRKDTLDALELVSGWSTWDTMRTTQRMSKARAEAVMVKLLSSLFAAVSE